MPMIMYNYASQNKYIRCPLCQNKYSVFNIRNHYVECYKKKLKHDQCFRDNRDTTTQTVYPSQSYVSKQIHTQNILNRTNRSHYQQDTQQPTNALIRRTVYQIFTVTNINDKYTQYYEKYLDNKHVALVGPASTMQNSRAGRIINSFDVIVRLNKALPISRRMVKDIGSRTDILYNSFNTSDFPGENVINEQFFLKNGVKFLCSSYPNIAPFAQDIKYYLDNCRCKLPFRMVKEDLYKKVKDNIHTRPNTGIMAIVDLLNTNLKKLYITGFSFYKTNYYNTYTKATTNAMVLYGNTYNQMHNQNSQINLLRYLVLLDKRVIVDKVLHQILFNHYITFYHSVKKLGRDNIFKFKSEDSTNILLDQDQEVIFVGNDNSNITVTDYDLIITMNDQKIINNDNIPLISINYSNNVNTIGIINLSNNEVDKNLLHYRCNKNYYSSIKNLLHNININSFSVEFYLILCLLQYFPLMDIKNLGIRDNNAEYLLLKYSLLYMRE